MKFKILLLIFFFVSSFCFSQNKKNELKKDSINIMVTKYFKINKEIQNDKVFYRNKLSKILSSNFVYDAGSEIYKGRKKYLDALDYAYKRGIDNGDYKKFKIINTIHNRSGTKALVQIEKTYILKGKERKVTETMIFKISNNKIYSIEYW